MPQPKKYVYSKVKKYTSKSKHNFSKINDKIKFIDFLINKNNDLQSIVEKKYPSIQRLLKNISEEQGCFLSRLTGSGSVCYGLFINEKCSIVALKRLRKKYPKFWFYIAKTI